MNSRIFRSGAAALITAAMATAAIAGPASATTSVAPTAPVARAFTAPAPPQGCNGVDQVTSGFVGTAWTVESWTGWHPFSTGSEDGFSFTYLSVVRPPLSVVPTVTIIEWTCTLA